MRHLGYPLTAVAAPCAACGNPPTAPARTGHAPAKARGTYVVVATLDAGSNLLHPSGRRSTQPMPPRPIADANFERSGQLRSTT